MKTYWIKKNGEVQEISFEERTKKIFSKNVRYTLVDVGRTYATIIEGINKNVYLDTKQGPAILKLLQQLFGDKKK